MLQEGTRCCSAVDGSQRCLRLDEKSTMSDTVGPITKKDFKGRRNVNYCLIFLVCNLHVKVDAFVS